MSCEINKFTVRRDARSCTFVCKHDSPSNHVCVVSLRLHVQLRLQVRLRLHIRLVRIVRVRLVVRVVLTLRVALIVRPRLAIRTFRLLLRIHSSEHMCSCQSGVKRSWKPHSDQQRVNTCLVSLDLVSGAFCSSVVRVSRERLTTAGAPAHSHGCELVQRVEGVC